MAKAHAKTESDGPRRLPRGRHALSAEKVREDQRRRLVEAVPAVVAARGYEAMSVADIVKAAGVSRNAFYENFADKGECFAAAHQACHERLLALLEQRCDRGASVEERVETALGAALDMLAAEPALARLLFVEAPAASEEIALRHHEWLRRYGALLRSTTAPAPGGPSPAVEIDEVIVGGLASRVASQVLQAPPAELRLLTPHFVDYVLVFYGTSEPAAAAADVPTREADRGTARYPERQRRQASA